MMSAATDERPDRSDNTTRHEVAIALDGGRGHGRVQRPDLLTEMLHPSLGDVIDLAVGLSLEVKIGSNVHLGDRIGRILATTQDSARQAEQAVQTALIWSPTPVAAPR